MGLCECVRVGMRVWGTFFVGGRFFFFCVVDLRIGCVRRFFFFSFDLSGSVGLVVYNKCLWGVCCVLGIGDVY